MFRAPQRTNTIATFQSDLEQSRPASLHNRECITVFEGEESRTFSDEADLRAYLQQFPEAQNNDASRLFQYYSDCPKSLRVALFDKPEFTRFSVSPPSAISSSFQGSVREVPKCQCDICQTDGYCGHHALACSVVFWHFQGTALDGDNRLEISAHDDLLSFFAGGSRTTFRLATWDLQVFRFPSRAIGGPLQAYDALIYQNAPIPATVHSVPVRYIIDVVVVFRKHLDALLGHGRRFLSHFSIQILSTRIESDRRVLNHLLEAAQCWKGIQSMVETQLISLRRILGDPQTESQWFQGAYLLNNTLVRDDASEAFDSLDRYAEAIGIELIQETDFLIQRITNLISINESYRSRDANASIRRLSWITFIFLPLVFAASVFGMNVDVLKDNPSWIFYIYFTIPLCVIIAVVYIIFRYGNIISIRVARAYKAAFSNNIDLDETMMNEAGIESWGAGPGQFELQRITIGDLQSNRPNYAIAAMDKPLIRATKACHMETARMLLSNDHVRLNQVDRLGRTALHYAALNGMDEIVQLLIDKGADTTVLDRKNVSPIQFALRGGNDKCIAAFLRSQYEASIQAHERSPLLSSLHYAALRNDVNLFDDILLAGCSRETRDPEGRTPLFYIVGNGDSNFVAHALRKGLNLHGQDFQGCSPLHVAVCYGFLDIVQLLLDSGAQVDSRDESKHTPLLRISAIPETNLNSRAILELLVQRGAQINATNLDGDGLAHLLARSSHDCADLIPPFVDLGGQLDLLDFTKYTPHHVAAELGKESILSALIERQSNVLTWDNIYGEAPIEVAARGGHIRIVYEVLKPKVPETGPWANRMQRIEEALVDLAITGDDAGMMRTLKESGAQVVPPPGTSSQSGAKNAFSSAVLLNKKEVLKYLLGAGCSYHGSELDDGAGSGRTLLQAALENGASDTARILLEAGVSVQGHDRWGWTCLHSAAYTGQVECARLIIATLPALNDTSAAYARDVYGWTALDLAAFYGHNDFVALLHPGGSYRYVWQRGPFDSLVGMSRHIAADLSEEVPLVELPVAN